MRGVLLWLRHHHVPQCVVVAVIGTLVCGFLTSSDAFIADVAPLWCATLATIPMLFVVIGEDDMDRTSSRSLSARRGVLVAVGAAVIICLAVVCYPDGGEFGMETMLRDSLALAGLGAASTVFLPTTAIWVVPLLVAFASSLFAWPLDPTIMHGVWGFLRAPSGWQLTPGVPNLAWLVSAVIGIGGIALGVFRRSDSSSGARQGSRHCAPGGLARGLRRARLFWPVMALNAVIVAWMLFSALPFWGGSVRLLLAANAGSAPFSYLTCAAISGAVASQVRWHTGVVVWERVSPRDATALFWRSTVTAMIPCVIGVLVAVGIAAGVAVGGMAHDGVPASIIGREIGAGLGPLALILVSVAVTCGCAAALGWFLSGPWVAPVAAVLALGLALGLPKPVQPVGADHIREYGYTVCTDTRYSRVCTSVPNSGYLPAAATMVDEIYAESDHPEVLPRRVVVTDGQYMGMHAVPETPATIPVTGLAVSRAVTAPETLSSFDTRDSLAYSMHDWCPGTDLGDVQTLLGINSPDTESATMPTTLRALGRCRG